MGITNKLVAETALRFDELVLGDASVDVTRRKFVSSVGSAVVIEAPRRARRLRLEKNCMFGRLCAFRLVRV